LLNSINVNFLKIGLTCLISIFSNSAFASGQDGMVLGLFYFACISLVVGFISGIVVTAKEKVLLKHLLGIYYFVGINIAFFSRFQFGDMFVMFLIQTILGLPLMAVTYLLGMFLTKKVIDITTNDIDFPSAK
jgi:hypothetical protein